MDTHDRLLSTLAALVADGELSEEQAATILINWREIAGLDTMIPLPTAAGIVEEDDDRAAILVILVAVLGARAATARRPEDVYRRLAPRYRRPVIDTIQDYHAEQAAALADDLAAGRISLSQWQAAARRLNQTTIRTMAELGSATGQITNYAAAIRTIQIEQAAYLQRFTEQIAASRIAAARPDLFPAGARRLSFEQIAARHAMYSGPGRSLYFQLSEDDEAGDDGAGWIVIYHARDDNRTCSPCHNAAMGSPYLPGLGPMPGDVCLGGGACRCSREMIYDPAEYARLSGSAAPQTAATP